MSRDTFGSNTLGISEAAFVGSIDFESVRTISFEVFATRWSVKAEAWESVMSRREEGRYRGRVVTDDGKRVNKRSFMLA